jgi:hypothetical protein
MDELQRELNSDEGNLETFLKLEQQFVNGDTFTDLIHDAILTESDLPESCSYSVLSSTKSSEEVGHDTIVEVSTPLGTYFDLVSTYKKREVTGDIDMSKAIKFLELYELLEALGLDMLTADLAGNLKRVGFTEQEIERILKEVPSFVDGKEQWADFLMKSGFKPLAVSHQKKVEDKLKRLSYFMARLKHKV